MIITICSKNLITHLFSKSYELPQSIDLTKINSFYRDGMLNVLHLPKRKEFHSQPKRIISVNKVIKIRG